MPRDNVHFFMPRYIFHFFPHATHVHVHVFWFVFIVCLHIILTVCAWPRVGTFYTLSPTAHVRLNRVYAFDSNPHNRPRVFFGLVWAVHRSPTWARRSRTALTDRCSRGSASGPSTRTGSLRPGTAGSAPAAWSSRRSPSPRARPRRSVRPSIMVSSCFIFGCFWFICGLV